MNYEIGMKSSETESMFDEYDLEFKNKILNSLKGLKEEEKTSVNTEKTNKFKLYLNNIIKLFKYKSKVKKVSLLQKLLMKLKNWWLNKTTESMRDLVVFLLIHGFMGMNALIALLTITNVNVNLVTLIKSNALLTCIVYLLGTGSIYYLLLDFNKELNESWGKLKVGKK